MGIRDRAKRLVHRIHSDDKEPRIKAKKTSSDASERHPDSQQNSPALGSNKENPKETALWEQAYSLLEQDSAGLLVTYREFLLSEDKDDHTPPISSPDFKTGLRNVIDKRLREIEQRRAKIPLAKKTTFIRDHIDKIIRSVNYFQQIASPLMSSEPNAMLFAGVTVLLSLLFNSVEQSVASLEGLADLSDLLVRCMAREETYSSWFDKGGDTTAKTAALQDLRTSFTNKTVKLYAEILKYQIRLACQLSRSTVHRILRNAVLADDWNAILDGIKTIDQAIMHDLREMDADLLRTVDERIASLQPQMERLLILQRELKDNTEYLKNAKHLEKLSRAPAAYNCRGSDDQTPLCLPGTRVEILQLLKDWRNSGEAKPVLWLHGMAGTGKSTLARTFASRAAEDDCLIGSFFFSRGGGDLSNGKMVVTTLASQLADATFLGPSIRAKICDTIAAMPDIGRQDMETQLRKLIVDPLADFAESSLWSYPLIIVIDALDECKSQADIKELLIALGNLRESLRIVNLRFFLTSRPGPPLSNFFDRFLGVSHLVLDFEQISGGNVRRDISVFIQEKIRIIREDFDLGYAWPGTGAIEALVEKSDPLFIYAATACRYIESFSISPDWGLKELLKVGNSTQGPLKQLYTMYEQIVAKAIGESPNEEAVLFFKRVIGTVATLREPLSISDIRALLGLPEAHVKPLLNRLRPVLDIPDHPTLPIRILHKSFRDFLTSDDFEFRIDGKQAHEYLFEKCIDVMSAGLKIGMCGHFMPGTSASNINESRLNEGISSELQYACRYWVSHLREIDSKLSESRVSQFLAVHLLHWIEACSWMQKVDELVVMVLALKNLYNNRTSDRAELAGLINDTHVLVMNRRLTISLAPLQIYSSALIFLPEESHLKRRFHCSMPSWISKRPTIDTASVFTTTIETFPAKNESFDISPDHSSTALGLPDGTLQFYSLETGNPTARVQAHSDQVKTVVFSHDGTQFASLSQDGTVKLWDLETKELRRSHEFPSPPTEIVFSSENHLLALVIINDTLELQNLTDSTLLILAEQCDAVWEWKFSWGAKRLAFAVGNRGHFQIYDVPTRNALTRVDAPGEKDTFNPLCFSADGELFAYCAYIRADVTEDGSYNEIIEVQVISAMGSSFSTILPNRCLSYAEFCLDNRYLAFQEDAQIVFWDLESQARTMTVFASSSNVNALKAIPGRLVTGFDDGTLRILDLDDIGVGKALVNHENPNSYASPQGLDSPDVFPPMDGPPGASFQTFSPDGERLAVSTWQDLSILDLVSGKPLPPISKDIADICTTCFSPDGQLLAMGFWGDAIKLWDLSSKTLVRSFELWGPKRGFVMSYHEVGFSPDGKYLVSQNDQRTAVWDLHTGGLVNFVPYNPERSGRIHVGSEYIEIDGNHVLPLVGNASYHVVEFPPHGRYLVSRNAERTAVWDLRFGEFVSCVLFDTGIPQSYSDLHVGTDYSHIDLVRILPIVCDDDDDDYDRDDGHEKGGTSFSASSFPTPESLLGSVVYPPRSPLSLKQGVYDGNSMWIMYKNHPLLHIPSDCQAHYSFQNGIVAVHGGTGNAVMLAYVGPRDKVYSFRFRTEELEELEKLSETVLDCSDPR